MNIDTADSAPAAGIPLSFGQEQLWFIEQFHAGLPTYHLPYAVRLTGRLDAAALGRALYGLVARHAPLRTRFVGDADGRPVQAVDEPGAVTLPTSDLTALSPDAREKALRDLAESQAVGPFALAESHPLRTHLVRLSDEEHVLIVVVHHIVFDALSIGVLLDDLTALYQAATGEPTTVVAAATSAAAATAGAPATSESTATSEATVTSGATADGLAPLPIQAAEEAARERERLSAGPELAELVDYWRGALARVQTLQLPTDRPRPPVVGHRGGVERLNLGAEALAGLRALSEQEGVTPFVVLLAAVQTLLHRYTGQDDIVVGTAAEQRARPELAPLIGFLINTLPIRSDLSGDPGFRELLGRVRDRVADARRHQGLPFARLLEEVDVERDTSRAPLFQVALTFAEAVPEIRLPELVLRLEQIDLPAAKFDLDFAARVDAGELWLQLTYDVGIFDASTARRILGHVQVLLTGAIADPARTLSQLPVLTEQEWRREVVEWNDTARPLPDVSIHEGFEHQVRRTPDAVAAELGDESVTYAELNAQANRIARRVRELGGQAEVLIGVSMAPSLRRLAVLLGIMKAGSGYVPLDPALPAERLSFMMADTEMPVVVADTAGARALPENSARVLPIDEEWDRIAKAAADDPHYWVQTSNTAYVIYTSGSTGQPKGVVVEHRHAVNFLLGMLGPWQVGPADRVLQFASLNFDVSVMDMFMTLLSGARAVLAPKETLLSPPRLADLIRDRQVTFACLPPAVVSLLTGEQFPDLRILLSAGEELSADLVRRWLRPGLHFYNGYGPTEAAIGSTFMEIDGSVFPPPIGRPKPNYQAYVLDPQLNPVPVGVVGELHVGGAGVTRGYLNAPELTERRFIPDPFRQVEGARLYKTGDLVRRNPDGTIVFVGRIDGQVKIRGLRVELGEVEAALTAHPAVAQAVAVVAADRSGQNQLAGYVRGVPGAPPVSSAELRRHLAERLPVYMVPTYLLAVDAIPLTSNGKVDRAALPAIDSADSAVRTEFVAPSTMLEAVVADLYAGLLGREEVGVDDGFFDLGGNSLQAMQLVTKLRSELVVDVDVTAVFRAPTTRQLAEFLRDEQGLEDVELAGLNDDAADDESASDESAGAGS